MDELKTETALMHIKKTNVDTYAINNGSPCFIVNTLFQPGDCPGRFSLGFVKEKAYRGDLQLNPYNFGFKWTTPDPKDPDLEDYFYINKITVSLNGNVLGSFQGSMTQFECMKDYCR